MEKKKQGDKLFLLKDSRKTVSYCVGETSLDISIIFDGITVFSMDHPLLVKK